MSTLDIAKELIKFDTACYTSKDSKEPNINPKEKRYAVSYLMNFYPCEEMLKELALCIPLCRNCHAEVHHEQGKNMMASPINYIKT